MESNIKGDTQENLSVASDTNVSDKKGDTEIVKVDLDVVNFNKNLKTVRAITLDDGPKNPDGLTGNPGNLHRYNRMMENKSGDISKYFHSK